VQVDPIKPKLKPPGTTPLKLQYDEPLSSFAFEFNLRRCTKAKKAKEKERAREKREAEAAERVARVKAEAAAEEAVGRCRLTLSKPELKARLVSALETKM
jgi:hypothetical protein